PDNRVHVLPFPRPSPLPSLASFFFTAPPPPTTYTLSLHDALPIYHRQLPSHARDHLVGADFSFRHRFQRDEHSPVETYVGTKNQDRKSTRLNSSHRTISYAVFCLKKKKKKKKEMNWSDAQSLSTTQ